ncbi:CPBP family intramembrane glutamic endopeptidase [Streptomyces sp. NPDC048565]|uniref:CPBP family intramembrane glutamic endopeptidase n=1 Tax=Streptomyces sp. NPDC048565 TaxID=3155266 RepID=UPI00344951A3
MTTTFTPPTPGAPAAPGRYRRDLILFLGIAFLASWLAWGIAMWAGGKSTEAPANLPYTLGAFGPLIAALVIRVLRRRRGEPVPTHVVRFRRKHLLRAPVLMVLGSATVVAAAFIGHAAGDPALSLDSLRDMTEEMGGPAVFLVSMIASGPLSEEAGWRGTAYPRLRATMGPFRVGLLLGVVWAVWHLPLFFIAGTPQHDLGLATPSGVLFAVNNIPMAMLVACAYDRAGIVASMGMHFAVNLTMVSLGITSPRTQAMMIGIQTIAVVLILAAGRRATKAEETSPLPTAPAAAPRPEDAARL